MLWDAICALVLIPAAPLPIQLPACGLESGQEQPKVLGLCTYLGDPEQSPGSCLQIGSAPAVAATWGMNHWTEDLPLCLFSLYI